MVDRQKIEKLVREKLHSQLGNTASSTNSKQALDFVNRETVEQLASQHSQILVTAQAVITPAARDAAEMAGVSFEVSWSDNCSQPESSFNPRSIALGADHGGYLLKEVIKKDLQKSGFEVVDVGTHSTSSVDYPDFAHAVATLVASGKCFTGIMIDGAGIGSSMVANKVPGVRAAHCHNLFEINNAKEHNNANLLTLGSRVIGEGIALEMVKLWLNTSFAGGRHQRRVDKIMQVEQRYFTKPSQV